MDTALVAAWHEVGHRQLSFAPTLAREFRCCHKALKRSVAADGL